MGDGDVAAELYRDRPIYGADLDAARVATARTRFPGADIREADCDGWPFPDVDVAFAVADLDSYSNPYKSLVAFLAGARTATRLVVFGTDGRLLGIKRTPKKQLGPLPEATVGPSDDPNHWREQFNYWWPRYVVPWLTELLAPATIAATSFYRRQHMIYWGIVVDRGPAHAAELRRHDRLTDIEDALYEAAKAGNVQAIDMYLRRAQRGAPQTPQAVTVAPTVTDTDAELGLLD